MKLQFVAFDMKEIETFLFTYKKCYTLYLPLQNDGVLTGSLFHKVQLETTYICFYFIYLMYLIVKNKLFVGSLSWDTTEDTLKAHFEQIGEVTECKIIIDKFKNRSKGFGFVTMATEELAQEAIEKLNDQELDGRALKVSIARPPKQFV